MKVPIEAVAYRGHMVQRDGEREFGYRPENHEWRDDLCERNEYGQLIGKDPMALPLDLLTAAGHPPSNVSKVNARLQIMHGTAGSPYQDGTPKASRMTTIREEVCIPCSSGNRAEVRRCHIYDCPAWIYRMGRNPHNPSRGKNPFAKSNDVGEGRAGAEGRADPL